MIFFSIAWLRYRACANLFYFSYLSTFFCFEFQIYKVRFCIFMVPLEAFCKLQLVCISFCRVFQISILLLFFRQLYLQSTLFGLQFRFGTVIYLSMPSKFFFNTLTALENGNRNMVFFILSSDNFVF